MRELTVVLYVYNNEAFAQQSIKSLRVFNDSDTLKLIVVDNGSTDGFGEWAKEQDDFTYVFFDEGWQNEGKALNSIISELNIQTDILFMHSSLLILPSTLGRIIKMMGEKEDLYALGGLSNVFSGNQFWSGVESCSDAINQSELCLANHSKKVLGLNCGAVVIRKESFDEIGLFDEDMRGLSFVIKDYMLRIIQRDKKIEVCDNVFFWGLDYVREEAGNELLGAAILEKKWGMHYFNYSPNFNLVSQINDAEDEEFNVLEIGCDCGATLVEINNKYPKSRLFGTDINEKAVEIASHFVEASVNNIEEQKLDYTKMFKYIIFGDVLEHLRNPLKVVEYCKEILVEDGSIIASIPNVMHISVINELLKGNFTYTETGLLDKTHIHLFTFNEIIRLFDEAGFEIQDICCVNSYMCEEYENAICKIQAIYPDTPRHMFETFQYIVNAKLRN